MSPPRFENDDNDALDDEVCSNVGVLVGIVVVVVVDDDDENEDGGGLSAALLECR